MERERERCVRWGEVVEERGVGGRVEENIGVRNEGGEEVMRMDCWRGVRVNLSRVYI
jgi:hypothetical protein